MRTDTGAKRVCERVLNVLYRNVNWWFVVLLQTQQQQQQTASSVWDVLLVYCHHFLQSGFTSAKQYTTGPTSKTRSMLSFIGRRIYLPSSFSLFLTHSVLLSFTRTLSCSVFVPFFLVHTLSFKHLTHTHTHSPPFFFFRLQLTRFCDNSTMSQTQIIWRPTVRMFCPTGVTWAPPQNKC